MEGAELRHRAPGFGLGFLFAKNDLEVNEMLAQVSVRMLCPRCGSSMIRGMLRGPVETIHVESLQSLEDSSLQAMICPDCGCVELQAANPEKLARHDLSDEEIDGFQ